MTTSSANLPARALTRVVIEQVAEVVIPKRDGVARRRIRRQQQSAILGRRGAAKRVGGTGDERAALLPDTLATRDAGGEDRVEGRANRRIHAPSTGIRVRWIGDVALARWIRRVLDTWQIGFEREPLVVEEVAGTRPGEQRATAAAVSSRNMRPGRGRTPPRRSRPALWHTCSCTCDTPSRHTVVESLSALAADSRLGAATNYHTAVRHGIKQREPGAVDAGARRDCERGAARGPDPSLAQSAPRVTSGGASVCVLASPSLSP